eukprot:jgi/Ulvmu1/8065/UM004_0302.1
MRERTCQRGGHRERLCLGGALVAVGLVCFRVLRHRRCARQLGAPARALSVPPQRTQATPVSADDWEDATCQPGVAGTALSQLSQQPGQTMRIERTYGCDNKGLMIFLFHPSSQFWHQWQANRGLQDLRVGSWSKHIDPQGTWYWTRPVNYVVPLNKFGSFGPSHAYTEEVFTLHMISTSRWEASITAKTPFVPMGNCFKIILALCGEDQPGGGSTLRVTGVVHFYKPMRLKELVVRRPALAGLRSTYGALLDLVSQQGVLKLPASSAAGAIAKEQHILQHSTQEARLAPRLETCPLGGASANLLARVGPMALVLLALLVLQQHIAWGGHALPVVTGWLAAVESWHTHVPEPV